MKPKRIFKRLLPRPEGRPARWPALRNVIHRIKRALWLAAVLAGPVLAQSGRPQKVVQAGPWDVGGSTVAVRCLTADGSAFESCAGGGSEGGGLTDDELRAAPVPVSGTFWQNTQPVSGTFWQAVQAVSQSGVWNIGATLAAETTKIIGTVNIAAGQTIAVTGTFWQAVQAVSGPLTDAQLRASIVPVGIKNNSGYVVYNATATALAGVTTEALFNVSACRDYVCDAAGTSKTVTAAKRLKLTSMCVTWRNNTAAAGGVTVRCRVNPGGAAAAASPIFGALNATTALATAGSGTTACTPLDIELSGNHQWGCTQIAVGAVVGFDFNLRGFEYTP